MNVDQHNRLVAASDAVEAALLPADRQVARDARNALIIEIYREIKRAHRGVYLNRWGPQPVTKIAAATGLSRVQVSRIVNNTPIPRSKRKAANDGSLDQS
jgi:DNA invertase Pin-like site-specific DNA recombinase